MPLYLAEWRKYRFMTQRELATATGITTRAITNIETGEVTEPRPSTLRKIAAALEIEPAQLYERPNLEGRK